MTEDPTITAVLVANDAMALGVIKALTEQGIDVPGDVSVVGFGDMSEARYFRPSLTTVRLDFNEVGRSTVARLLRLMGSKPPESRPKAQRWLLACKRILPHGSRSISGRNGTLSPE